MSDQEKLKTAAEKLAALVEPAADIPRQTMTDCMLASIAISMKRFADTLDGTAAGICVTETIFSKPR